MILYFCMNLGRLRYLGLGALLAFVTVSLQAERRPNVILMMLDDLSAVELSSYATNEHPAGNATPEIDRLAEEGLLFDTCWATPLCKPTRCLLMSGKYGYQTGQFGNRLGDEEQSFSEENQMLPKLMQDAGYRTGIAGKWHLPGSPEAESWGWDEYALLGGYLNHYGPNLYWDGLWFSWKDAAHVFPENGYIGKEAPIYPSMFWNACVVQNGELLPSDMDTYGPDLCHEFAMDFIVQESDEPFFLYYPTVLTHDPWFETPDLENPGKRTPPGMSSQVSYVQHHIDEMVAKLKDEGLYENTIVILTSDNATLRYGKGCVSEIGVRVPLMVFGGPVKARGRTDALVDFADMLPTVLDIAGVDASEVSGLNGQSFKAALDGDESFAGRPYLFSYLDAERTVRTREYMMDGAGGIWHCSPTGNPQDHKLLPEIEQVQAVRAKLLGLIEDYRLPEPGEFPGRDFDVVDVGEEPGVHGATKHYLELGDEWMNIPERSAP